MFATKFQNLHTRGILLLIATTLIWGTTFPVLKETVVSITPMPLIAIRFALAALVFAPWLRHLNARLLRDGVLLGLVYLASYITLTIGVETISAGRAAFMLSLNVFLVPVLGLFLGRRLQMMAVFAAGLAIAGIGIMSWEGGGFSIGDLWVFGGAFSYAIYILLLESATLRHPPLALSAIQLFFVAGVTVLWTAPEMMTQLPAIASHWGQLLYLSLVVTALTTITQAVAQQWVSAHETALLYTLEPVFAAIFSFWLLGEQFGERGFIGAGLILTAMVLSQSQASIAQWLGAKLPSKTPLLESTEVSR
ncbi:DMT family transporter [Stenomitos frigidus]|uniref:EamA family transporter n=1 Tax=Stenomitos frigidus ULC18 TaxID=2107698 RepID=A0A2T1ESF1_9CYAN|nr:DMT family transporter [Stenomitos frigidus]PSB35664.1 EamA family transporter [Stenomitos frigidus ULC18]